MRLAVPFLRGKEVQIKRHVRDAAKITIMAAIAAEKPLEWWQMGHIPYIPRGNRDLQL
jgi:hypothetical protein